MKILFAGGGTGGHLYSGVAVAREAERLAPGTEVVFVGTAKGIEAKVLPREGYRLITLKISGIMGRGVLGSLAGIFRAPMALASSLGLLRREKPGAVVGIGGYASGPTVIAACVAGYPTAIIEQNVVPGFTNRTLGRFVRRVYAPLQEAVARFPRPGIVKVTGNPIRRAVVDEAAKGAEASGFRVLVFGGSLGAHRINEAMVAALPRLKSLAGLSIVHQTGEADLEGVKAGYAKASVTADVRPFLHDMGAQYARADLVICRAGASTIAELLAIGKPALLVPYPHAIYDHQRENAKALAKEGACRWIDDASLSGDRLATELESLAKDPAARAALASNAKRLGRPDAATVIAEEVLAMAKPERRAA